MPYENTPNKRCIRNVWDRPILAALRQRKGAPLFYFGLTGPEMFDILDWRDLLADRVTSVEEPGEHFEDNIYRMVEVATQNGFGAGLIVHPGKIEGVITKGQDIDGVPLAKSFIRNGLTYYNYDVINLDFDGGLGNVLTRHKAISELLRRQAMTEFTLFITFNVRHRLHAAVSQELDNLRNKLGMESKAILEWYCEEERAEALRVKAIVPGIIAHYATAVQLDCRAYSPIIYEGAKNAKLVHFAFDLRPRDGVFRGHSPGAADLLSLPSMVVTDGELDISDEQDPAFSIERCRAELEFLGTVVADEVVKRHRGNVAKSESARGKRPV